MNRPAIILSIEQAYASPSGFRDGAHLLLDALHPAGTGDQKGRQNLDGDIAPHPRVVRRPHLALPPAPMRETISNAPSFVPLLIVMEGSEGRGIIARAENGLTRATTSAEAAFRRVGRPEIWLLEQLLRMFNVQG